VSKGVVVLARRLDQIAVRIDREGHATTDVHAAPEVRMVGLDPAVDDRDPYSPSCRTTPRPFRREVV
jgi:hypothetical protein